MVSIRMLRVFASFLLELLPLVMATVTTDYYRTIRACTATSPLTSVIQSIPGMSRIRCAQRCSQSSTCSAISMSTDGTSTCSLHSDPPTVLTCPVSGRHMQKVTNQPCLNGGEFNSTTNTCKCFDGYIGERCEKIMQDCSEGGYSGQYTVRQGVFWIFPKLAPAPFKVSCWMTPKITVMQNQKYGNVSFARTWEEYKSGFGDCYGDLWLGLDKLYYVVNSRPHILLVAAKTSSSDGKRVLRYFFYFNFKISNESNQYRVDFHEIGSRNFLGDCMTILKNAPFSTVDVNNVDACASDFNAGWWFSAGSCSSCNPNGALRTDLHWSHDVRHTHWTPVVDNWGMLQISLMLRAQ